MTGTRGKGRWIAAVMLAGALPAVPRCVRAEESAPLALQYKAPQGCPRAPAALTRMASRGAPVREITPGEAPKVRVEILPRRGPTRGFVAHVEVDDGGGPSARDVEGMGCEAVVDAVGLVLSMAAREAEERHAREERAKASEPPPPGEAPVAPPAVTSPSGSGDGGGVPSATPATRVQWGAVLRGGALSGAAPGFLPRVELAGDVDGGSWGPLRPRLRVGLLYGGTSRDQEGALAGARVGFAFVGASLAACPRDWALPGLVTLRPCLRLEGGRLQAEAQGGVLATAQAASSSWFGGGPTLLVSWSFTRALDGELEAGALFPVQRARYVVDPDVLVHHATAVSAFVALGVRVHGP